MKPDSGNQNWPFRELLKLGCLTGFKFGTKYHFNFDMSTIFNFIKIEPTV